MHHGKNGYEKGLEPFYLDHPWLAVHRLGGLRHRLILRPEAQLDGVDIDSVIRGLIAQVAVPR